RRGLAVAHVAGLRDLRRLQHAVGVDVEAHVDALAAGRAVHARRFDRQLDQRVDADAGIALRALRALRTGGTLRACVALWALRALRTGGTLRPGVALRTRHQHDRRPLL